jgi:hypothetical protein
MYCPRCSSNDFSVKNHNRCSCGYERWYGTEYILLNKYLLRITDNTEISLRKLNLPNSWHTPGLILNFRVNFDITEEQLEKYIALL